MRRNADSLSVRLINGTPAQVDRALIMKSASIMSHSENALLQQGHAAAIMAVNRQVTIPVIANI